MKENKFGLKTKDWELLKKILITPLQTHECKIWIFGSRATGAFRQFSDIDILFEPSHTIPSDLIGQIKEDLENSNLPIKVDLVQKKDLAKGYLPHIESQLIGL